MSNNPFAGRVPLNLRKPGEGEAVVKSTSYRPGETHRLPVRDQYNDPKLAPRNVGCTPLRRYPNGKLDIKYVADTIVSLIHKAQDSGKLTEFEKALLTVVLPNKFNFGMTNRLAGTMARLDDEEKILVAMTVHGHMKEVANWNAGRGGGSVPGRHITRS